MCHVKVNFQNPRRLNWPEIIKIKSYRGSLSLPLFMFLKKISVLFYFSLCYYVNDCSVLHIVCTYIDCRLAPFFVVKKKRKTNKTNNNNLGDSHVYFYLLIF